jgi:hypothetical protein
MVSGDKKKGRRSSEVVLKTKNKSPNMYAEEKGGKEAKKMNVAHWGEAKLAPPTGYDRRDNPREKHEEEQHANTHGKKGKRNSISDKIVVKGEPRHGKRDSMVPQPAPIILGAKPKKPGLLQRAATATGLGNKYKGENSNFDRGQRKKNNVQTFGSIVVSAGIVIGVMLAIV